MTCGSKGPNYSTVESRAVVPGDAEHWRAMALGLLEHVRVLTSIIDQLVPDADKRKIGLPPIGRTGRMD